MHGKVLGPSRLLCQGRDLKPTKMEVKAPAATMLTVGYGRGVLQGCEMLRRETNSIRFHVDCSCEYPIHKMLRMDRLPANPRSGASAPCCLQGIDGLLYYLSVQNKPPLAGTGQLEGRAPKANSAFKPHGFGIFCV